jgi:hypothetical protein
MRQDILPEVHAGRTAGDFLEQQQDGFALLRSQGKGAIMIAQPRDFAELAMLAKGDFILGHAINLGRPVANAMGRAGSPDHLVICNANEAVDRHR